MKDHYEYRVLQETNTEPEKMLHWFQENDIEIKCHETVETAGGKIIHCYRIQISGDLCLLFEHSTCNDMLLILSQIDSFSDQYFIYWPNVDVVGLSNPYPYTTANVDERYVTLEEFKKNVKKYITT